jgi:hypothetical protein
VFSYPSQRMFKGTPHRRLQLGTGAILTLIFTLSLLPAAPAEASTATCPTATVSQPFLKWGDENQYQLVTGGDFEGTLPGWTLSHGAQQTSGSETYGVTGKVGTSSLALPSAGASAQSPFTCVSASDPTFRLFARSEGPTATISVAVAYQSLLGVIVVPVASVTPNSGWQPTAALPTGAVIAGALSSNGTAQLALRFTAVRGSSRIDDVFIDPRMR